MLSQTLCGPEGVDHVSQKAQVTQDDFHLFDIKFSFSINWPRVNYDGPRKRQVNDLQHLLCVEARWLKQLQATAKRSGELATCGVAFE
jgi:hypothetical protein